MALFGLTAVDVNANSNPMAAGAAATAAGASGSHSNSGSGGTGSNSNSGGAGSSSGAANTDAPGSSHGASGTASHPAPSVPDLLNLSPNSTYLTEVPSTTSSLHPTSSATLPSSSPAPAAAAAAGVTPTPSPSARAAKALAPMVTPPSPPPPAASTSSRALAALATSPVSSATRRLPPIGGGGGGSASGAGGSPERDRSVPPPPLSTPPTRVTTTATPRDSVSSVKENPIDSRSFDGRELGELVRVSVEDYRDVRRVQDLITIALAGKTTEAAKAEALLQIREASLHNPMFSLTPALVDLVREHLFSRNRLLRPAAAYALAGYAANSRYGRGLLAGVNAAQLLVRLNAMLKCKVDSMDARYAALAVVAASMHVDHKEMMGRSGCIPLLIALVRQNVGTVPTPARPPEVSLEQVINGLHLHLDSERSSLTSNLSDGSSAADQFSHPASHPHPHQHQHPQQHPHGPAHLLPTSPSHPQSQPHPHPHQSGALQPHPHPHSPQHSGGLSSPRQPQHPAGTQAANGSAAFHPHHHHHHPDHHHHPGGAGGPGGGMMGFHVHAWGSDSGGAEGFGVAAPGGGMPRAFTSEAHGQGRGSYTLVVKPAAAHAMAALVNLAELPANRQIMREAGIASLLEDVFNSRNDNVIKERGRLLVDYLQVDTGRFRETQAAAEVSTVTAVAGAVIHFVNRAKQAKAAVAAAAAAAAAERPRTGSGAGPYHGARSMLGTPIKGSLAWSLAQQLERGDEEGDRRMRTFKERNARAMSRVQSQVHPMHPGTQSHVRRHPPAGTTSGGQEAGSGGAGTGAGGGARQGSGGGAGTGSGGGAGGGGGGATGSGGMMLAATPGGSSIGVAA